MFPDQRSKYTEYNVVSTSISIFLCVCVCLIEVSLVGVFRLHLFIIYMSVLPAGMSKHCLRAVPTDARRGC